MTWLRELVARTRRNRLGMWERFIGPSYAERLLRLQRDIGRWLYPCAAVVLVSSWAYAQLWYTPLGATFCPVLLVPMTVALLLPLVPVFRLRHRFFARLRRELLDSGHPTSGRPNLQTPLRFNSWCTRNGISAADLERAAQLARGPNGEPA